MCSIYSPFSSGNNDPDAVTPATALRKLIRIIQNWFRLWYVLLALCIVGEFVDIFSTFNNFILPFSIWIFDIDTRIIL